MFGVDVQRRVIGFAMQSCNKHFGILNGDDIILFSVDDESRYAYEVYEVN